MSYAGALPGRQQVPGAVGKERHRRAAAGSGDVADVDHRVDAGHGVVQAHPCGDVDAA